MSPYEHCKLISWDKNSTDLSTPLDHHTTMALGHPWRWPGVIFPSHHILHTKLRRDPRWEVGCQLSCVRQYRQSVNGRGGHALQRRHCVWNWDTGYQCTHYSILTQSDTHAPMPPDKNYTYSAFGDINLSHSYTTATQVYKGITCLSLGMLQRSIETYARTKECSPPLPRDGITSPPPTHTALLFVFHS